MATEVAARPTANGAKPAWEGGLSERIAWVMGEIDDIRATGRNQFSATALSIGDVEGVLRPFMAQAQVVTRFSMTDLEQIDKALWRATFRVTVSGGGESIEDQWIDIGGNPMAASSFARKGYLKALFHVSEDKDEQGQTATTHEPRERTVQTASPRPSADWQPVKPVTNIPASDPCPVDACTGHLVQRDGGHGLFVSCTNYTECGFKPVDGTIEEYRVREAELAAVKTEPAIEHALSDVDYIRSVWQKVNSDERMTAFGTGELARALSMNSKNVWVLKPEGVELLKAAPADRVRAVAQCFRLLAQTV